MINIENLRKIYHFIDALPDEKVNMMDWRSMSNCYSTNTELINECGTCACVVGWLPVIFKEEDPRRFSYADFAYKVGCLIGEAEDVCRGYRVEDSSVGRNKNDALLAMYELAIKYGHSI